MYSLSIPLTLTGKRDFLHICQTLFSPFKMRVENKQGGKNMQTDFEVIGGTYTNEGDYLVPDVDVPETLQVCVWGERRRKHLQTSRNALYTAMLLGDTLNDHLVKGDKAALEMFDRLMGQLKHRDCITEELKTADQLEWAQCMNEIYYEAAEVVMKGLICV